MNKNNTMSLCVGYREVAGRWDLGNIPKFKKSKDMEAVNRLEGVEGIVITSGHHGHDICSKKKRENRW
jgi:hypothetical protein